MPSMERRTTSRVRTEDLQSIRPILISLAELMISPMYRSYIDASDLVQQTLLEAHAKQEQLDSLEDTHFQKWLHVALRNNLVDAIRKLRSAKHDVSRDLREADLHDSFARLSELFLAEQTSPSEMLQRGEEISRMLTKLQSLPENQRIAVTLKHLKGDSLRDVAETMGLSEPAVAGLLHRGRQQLLQLMSRSE